MNGTFALDKDNARLIGVCSGIASWTNCDLLIVRLGVVAATLLLTPVVILLYVVTGLVARQR